MHNNSPGLCFCANQGVYVHWSFLYQTGHPCMQENFTRLHGLTAVSVVQANSSDEEKHLFTLTWLWRWPRALLKAVSA